MLERLSTLLKTSMMQMFNERNDCNKLISFWYTHSRFCPLEKVFETKTETKPAAPINFFQVPPFLLNLDFFFITDSGANLDSLCNLYFHLR